MIKFDIELLRFMGEKSDKFYVGIKYGDHLAVTGYGRCWQAAKWSHHDDFRGVNKKIREKLSKGYRAVDILDLHFPGSSETKQSIEDLISRHMVRMAKSNPVFDGEYIFDWKEDSILVRIKEEFKPRKKVSTAAWAGDW